MNKLIKHILDNNLVVNCRTEEDVKELLRLAHESGLKWSPETPYTEFTCWETYRERSCYALGDGGYCSDEFFNVKNVKIIDFQELKKELEIGATQNKETVLEVEFVDVFDGYKAWRIVKQDDEIFKRGFFIDKEIEVHSYDYPFLYQDNTFAIRGTNTEKDSAPEICTNEQANIIKEKVRLINEKYGRPKFDAEDEYKKLNEVEFVYGTENYFVRVDDSNKFKIDYWINNKKLGTKYISKEDAEEFCRRSNGEK